MVGNLAPEWDYLLSPEGTAQLLSISERISSGESYFQVGAQLRRGDLDHALVAPLLSQAELQHKARTKFGALAQHLRFTPAGLEQATRDLVARTHAQRFAAAQITEVADLGCGIGAESLQLLSAGVNVLPVEIDPLTAEIAQFNLSTAAEIFGQAAPTVHLGSAESFALPAHAGVFLDPARRTAGHRDTRRLASPDDYTPSLTFAFGHTAQRATGVKLGPGFERELIPEDAEAQWVSVDHQVVETGIWSGALARPGIRRSALVIRGTEQFELHAPADAPDVPVGDLGEYVYEPDGAVIRARLIGLLAESLTATMLSEGIAYLTSNELHHTPFASAFRVLEILPTNEKQLRRALAERNIGTLEIKKRGVDVDPAALRTKLKLKGSRRSTIIMTRVAGKHTTLLVERCTPPSPTA